MQEIRELGVVSDFKSRVMELGLSKLVQSSLEREIKLKWLKKSIKDLEVQISP